MTVNTTSITSGPYTGNGITDTFAYTFRIEDEAQIAVYETDSNGAVTELTLTTDYTVTGVGDDGGGNVVLTAPLASGHKLYVRSDYNLTQDTSFPSQGGFFPDVHEAAFDKLTILVQQLYDITRRTARLPNSYSGGVVPYMAPPVANGYLRWSDDGTSLVNDTAVASVGGAIGSVVALSEIITEIEATYLIRNDVTTVAGIAEDVTAVAGVSAAVGTLANMTAEISRVDNIAEDVTAVAGVAEDVTAVAGVAEDVTAVVGLGFDITTLSAIADDITGVSAIADEVQWAYSNSTEITGTYAIRGAIQTVAANIADIQAAEENADRAESARDIAVAAAGEITSTSSTSLAIGTGSTTWATGTGLSWAAGMHIIAHDRADASNSMSGTITSYDDATGELVVDVDVTSGSGTVSNWVIVNQVRAANILQVSKHSRVGRRFQFDYLTGNASSVDVVYAATQKEAVFQVGDTIEVAAYSPTSPKCPAVWECTAVDAELPDEAVPGSVWGAAEGRLYVVNPGGGYFRFESQSHDLRAYGGNAADESGEINFAALRSAIEAARSVEIEEVYTVFIPDSPIAVESFASVSSRHGRGGLHLIAPMSRTLCEVPDTAGSIAFINVSVSSVDGADDPVQSLISVQGEAFLERAEITGCRLAGRVRAMNCVGSLTADPSGTPFGVKHFIYEKNTAKNIRTTHIMLVNSPTEVARIVDNEVTNFGFVFYSAGNTNGADNENAVRDARKRLECLRNTVVIEDDFWHYTNASPGSYYAFVLHQGVHAIYRNNIVSGMKTELDVALYDAYLSSIHVEYDDNTWENNVRFTSSTLNNALIKCKADGGTNEGNSPQRYYRRNKFFVDTEWVTRIGKTDADCWVNLFDLAPGSDNEITDNSIDVIGLSLTTTTENVNSFVFDRNTMNAKYVKAGSGVFSLRREVAMRAIPCSISFNRISIREASAVSNVSVFKGHEDYVWDADFVIAGNEIVFPPDFNIDYVIGRMNARKLIVSQNRFDVSYRNFLFSTKIASLVGGGNTARSAHSSGTRSLFGATGNAFLTDSNFNLSESVVSEYARLNLYDDAGDLLEDLDVYCDVTVRVVSQAGSGTIAFGYSVYYSQADNAYKVAFTDTNANPVDVVIGSGGEHNTVLDFDLLGGLALSARLRNISGGTSSIEITGIGQDRATVEWSVRVVNK